MTSLRVRAELLANASPSVVHQCRTIVLDWIQKTLKVRMPRKAWRHRPFSRVGSDVTCRAVRVRDGQRDHWAVQLEHTRESEQREVVTEVVVSNLGTGGGSIDVSVQDRSAVPVGTATEYPAEMLAAIAERVPLLLDGRRLTHRPIVVESDATMNAFLEMLVDPGRQSPFAVVSVPPDDHDRDQLKAWWDSLARSLTGLAVTWVLPAAMTYRLSDTVGKSLSVFLGAWRFYRPGFDLGAQRSDHPLTLSHRMAEARGAEGTAKRFLQMAADESMRTAPRADDSLTYDGLAWEAASAPRGPARLISLLRDSIRGATAPDQGQNYTARETGPLPARSLAQPTVPAPALVREPSSSGARRRAERAELERDEAIKRADQLAGLVRSMGGDPDAAVPFPTTWDDFGDWCDECLAGRVTLTGSARRELRAAEFSDVSLAARCFCWLADDYRDGRLKGGTPRLHGRINDIAESVFNAPCGGDTFDCSWCGENHSVDWHIKVGGNTRDPRRCLNIYYFWDEDTRQVVVASIPGHRRNLLS